MTTSAPTRGISRDFWRRMSLRSRLFVSSAVMSTVILLAAAWVINNLVVKQARLQVQSEVEDLMPVYEAALDENARSLARVGTTVANSPIVKTVFGDPGASRSKTTIHEMIADVTSDLPLHLDLIIICDGSGRVTFAEIRGGDVLPLPDIPGAALAGEEKVQTTGFTMIRGKLYQLALTPILLQSASTEFRNTLAVVGTGFEVNREYAAEIHKRLHSDIAFFVKDVLFASSFEPALEEPASSLIRNVDGASATSGRPAEVSLQGHHYIAFARQLHGFQKDSIGTVIVVRSLDAAGKLFGSISNLLLVLWTVSLVASFAISYITTTWITRPIPVLIESARAVGAGIYDQDTPDVGHGELGELAAALTQMRSSLKEYQSQLLKRERLAAVGQMASSIVHDLRNPLATISTAAELLGKDGLSTEKRLQLAESQVRAGRRMQSMLSDALEYTSGSFRLEFARYRLHSIVDKAIQTVQPERLGIALHVGIPPALEIEADGERLRRVFENLLANAVQAIPRDWTSRRISINAQIEHSEILLTFSDSGPGIPQEIKDRLFEPFVTHGKPGGTGLGLAICKSIIEAHHGTIEMVGSTLGRTEFSILLPAVQPQIQKRDEYATKDIAG